MPAPAAAAGDEAPQRRGRPPPKKKKKLPSTKNQLRSVERLLSKVTDAKARTALEQRRAALLKTQADAARAEKERKFAVRYHKVKFFERKKIMKAQAKLAAEIEAQGWANAEQRAALKQLDEDEEYVTHFPKNEKYVSIFKRDGDEAHAEAERVRLRALIKANLAATALLAENDEGGVDVEDAAAADDVDDALEEDEFFSTGGAGGGGGGHVRFGDADGGGPAGGDGMTWHTNALFAEEAGEREQPRGTPQQGGQQVKKKRGGVGRGVPGAPGEGKKRAAVGSGGAGGPPAKRARPEQQQRQQQHRGGAGGGGGGAPTPQGKRTVFGRGGGAVQRDAPAWSPRAGASGFAGGRTPPGAAAKPAPPPAPPPAPKLPLRTRAEGGRKRRPKK